MKSVQGHSGGQHIDPQLRSIVRIPYGWTDYIYHVGDTFDHRSTYPKEVPSQVQSEFEEGRQTCFLTAVGPMDESMLTLRYEPSKPRQVPHNRLWAVTHKAARWFDVRPAQNKGLVLSQTITIADISCVSMQADCLVNVVRRNMDDTELEIRIR